jgi:hypothetical protein
VLGCVEFSAPIRLFIIGCSHSKTVAESCILPAQWILILINSLLKAGHIVQPNNQNSCGRFDIAIRRIKRTIPGRYDDQALAINLVRC